MTRFLKVWESTVLAGLPFSFNSTFRLFDKSVSPKLKVASKKSPIGKLYSAPIPKPKSNFLSGVNDSVTVFCSLFSPFVSILVRNPKFIPTLGRNPLMSYFTQRGILSC